MNFTNRNLVTISIDSLYGDLYTQVCKSLFYSCILLFSGDSAGSTKQLFIGQKRWT